jgi:hypothetical protein
LAASCVPKNALEVDVEDLVVLGLGRVQDGGPGLDAGVVDHDVEVPERAHRRRDQPLEVVHLAHIGLDTDRLVAELGDLLLQLLGRGFVGHVVDDHAGTRRPAPVPRPSRCRSSPR